MRHRCKVTVLATHCDEGLQRLESLHERGVLTDNEFAAQKARILRL